MHRLSSLLLAAGLLVMGAMPHASAQTKFPTITTQNLNERSATFPKGLPGQRTIVLVAFYREQQRNLDVWIDKLGLKKPKAPAWIEMPVVPNYGSLWRSFVDNGMRSGIVAPEARAKVFTVYGNRDQFRSRLNLPTADKVYVLVVKRDGTILARADGDFTPDKAARIRKALPAKPS